MLLTGGPGTGKTYTVRSIVAQWRAQGLRVLMACPTARAATVLAEAVGGKASTIHRLLEYNPHEDLWKRDRLNPLETDALVVDEASMLDVQLAARLLDAMPDYATHSHIRCWLHHVTTHGFPPHTMYQSIDAYTPSCDFNTNRLSTTPQQQHHAWPSTVAYSRVPSTMRY